MILNVTKTSNGRALFLVILFVSALSVKGFSESPPEPTGKISTPNVGNICDRHIKNILAATDETGGLGLDVESFVLNKAERVEAVCSFRRAFIERYSLLAMKKERFGVDVGDQLLKCAEIESNIEKNSDIEFYDRLLKCFSPIRDSHIAVFYNSPNVTVATGIQADWVDGELYVSAINKELLILAKKSLDDSASSLDDITPGTKILKIDGKKPLYAVKGLEPFLSEGADQTSFRFATAALFYRDFYLPNKNYVELDIKTDGGERKTVWLPWISYADNLSVEGRAFVKDRDYLLSDRIRTYWNKEKKQWMPRGRGTWEGYGLEKPLVPHKYLERYVDEDGDPVVELGNAPFKSGRSFCYLKLSAVRSEAFLKGSDKEESVLPVMKEFLNRCRQDNQKLIFDLRQNGGGSLTFAVEILKLFATDQVKRPGSFADYIPSKRLLRQVLSQENENPVVNRAASTDSWFLHKEIFSETDSGSRVGKRIYLGDIEGDVSDNYDTQNMVTLVSSACVSGCEIISTWLSQNHISQVLGSPVAGTGAGYFGEWSYFNDPSGQFSVVIPEFRFGLLSYTTDKKVLDRDDIERFRMENKPFEISEENLYSLQNTDLTENGAGWLARAVEVLFNDAAPIEQQQ